MVKQFVKLFHTCNEKKNYFFAALVPLPTTTSDSDHEVDVDAHTESFTPHPYDEDDEHDDTFRFEGVYILCYSSCLIHFVYGRKTLFYGEKTTCTVIQI